MPDALVAQARDISAILWENGRLKQEVADLRAAADPARAALAELRDAVAFLDKVRAATPDEQIAVGTDARDRLEKAVRDVMALWPEGGR